MKSTALLATSLTAILATQAVAQNTPLGGLEPGPRAEDAAADARDALPETYPRISGGIAIELENDYTFAADDNAAELNDLFPTVEGAFAFEWTQGTGVFSTVVLEPVFDPTDDREFEDVGLFVEELFGSVTVGQFEVKGGKFNPAFGTAFDTAPGIFGTGFAEDYELTERIGGGVGFTAEALGAEHTLSAALFLADRSALSGSLFENRGQLSRADGGASNTGGPESFSLAAEGAYDALSYNLGFRYQTGGLGDASDEVGFVAGLAYQDIDMGTGDLSLLAEVAYLANADGAASDAVVLTAGGAFVVDEFTVSGVYALRDVSGAGGSTDHLLTTTVEYEVIDGLIAAAGYAYSREGGEDAHTLGVLFAFEIGGGYSFGR